MSDSLDKARNAVADAAGEMAGKLKEKPPTQENVEHLDKIAQAVERVAFGSEYTYNYRHHGPAVRRAGFE